MGEYQCRVGDTEKSRRESSLSFLFSTFEDLVVSQKEIWVKILIR